MDLTDPKQAKQFLIDNLVKQAQSQGTPLTEAETRMLGFSVEDWTIEEQHEAQALFDQEGHREAEYEAKISALAQGLVQADPSLANEWNEAIDTLSQGDHYILVMVGPKPQGINVDWRIAVLVIGGLVLWIVWLGFYRGR